MPLSSLTLLDRDFYQDCVQVLDMHYYDDFFLSLGLSDEDFERLARRVGVSPKWERGSI
jgi:hypothetical protein